MTEEARKNLGKAGMLPEENQDKANWRHELGEQKLFRQFLHRYEIRYASPRTDRKSTLPAGVSDFIVFCPRGETMIIEFKAPGKKMTRYQEAFYRDLKNFGHSVHLFYWAQDAMSLIRTKFVTVPE